jgi:hypothetical protein
MKWLVQRDDEQRAHEVCGTFEDAVRFAKRYCRAKSGRCKIFELPRNVRIAEVDRQGLRWKAGNWLTTAHWPTPDHPEWTRMWASLYALTSSYCDENPKSGERWQYTGCYWKRRPAIGALLPVDVLVHEFRHRDRLTSCDPIPGTSRSYGRVVLCLTASHDFSGNWNHPIPEGTLI